MKRTITISILATLMAVLLLVCCGMYRERNRNSITHRKRHAKSVSHVHGFHLAGNRYQRQPWRINYGLCGRRNGRSCKTACHD